jgi:hypothetical protein
VGVHPLRIDWQLPHVRLLFITKSRIYLGGVFLKFTVIGTLDDIY